MLSVKEDGTRGKSAFPLIPNHLACKAYAIHPVQIRVTAGHTPASRCHARAPRVSASFPSSRGRAAGSKLTPRRGRR